jgi:HEAT repeat protein
MSNGEWQLYRLRRALYARTPLIGGWRRRRAARALTEIDEYAAVELLTEAVTLTKDRHVRAIALDALREIEDWRRISLVCNVWAKTRHPDLEALIVERGWVASTPPRAKVFSALLVDELDAVREGDERTIEPLIEACGDRDSPIAQRARQALGDLRTQEAQDAACRFVIENENDAPDASLQEITRIIRAAGYTPADEGERAAYFFLTGQWARYEGLDYDQRLLRSIYAAADDPLRRRIREKLRAAGRADFLTAIAGEGYLDRAAEMTPAELDLLLQTLTSNHKWPVLWKLIFEVPLVWSMRAAQTLVRENWTPENGDDEAVFQKLVALLQSPPAPGASESLPQNQDELRALIPPAVRQAQARVPGRVNDVAFSPTRSVIAVGAGVRKIVVWNYQHARREYVSDELAHSIGNVTFTGDGALLAGERTNSVDTPCAIYYWPPSPDQGWAEHPTLLGEHTGSVTALAPVDETRLLSTGRDRQVILWDVPAREAVTTSNMSYFWPRSARISPSGRQVALLYQGVHALTLPQLAYAGLSGGSKIVRSAAFADEETVIAGEYGGDVRTFQRQGPHWFQRSTDTLTQHAGRVEGVTFLRRESTVVTAGSEGVIHFIAWPDREVIADVETPVGQITSLHISPDGAFMAIGHAAAALSLWDLRILQIRQLLERPFAQADAQALAVLSLLVDNEGLSPAARRILHFAQHVLRHRARFDIELGDAPSIMLGEFDIEID